MANVLSKDRKQRLLALGRLGWSLRRVEQTTGVRRETASTCEPYGELIERALARDRNAVAMWHDLVSEHSFTIGYQRVKRFVHRLRGTQAPEAHSVIVTEENVGFISIVAGLPWTYR